MPPLPAPPRATPAAPGRARRRLALAALALAAACRSGSPAAVQVVRIESPALEPGRAFASRELLRGAGLSAHAVRLRGELAPHWHARHDEMVLVLEGTARMWIDGELHELGPGSLVHVPRGRVHAASAEDALVLSLFDPPFDGDDRVFADR